MLMSMLFFSFSATAPTALGATRVRPLGTSGQSSLASSPQHSATTSRANFLAGGPITGLTTAGAPEFIDFSTASLAVSPRHMNVGNAQLPSTIAVWVSDDTDPNPQTQQKRLEAEIAQLRTDLDTVRKNLDQKKLELTSAEARHATELATTRQQHETAVAALRAQIATVTEDKRLVEVAAADAKTIADARIQQLENVPADSPADLTQKIEKLEEEYNLLLVQLNKYKETLSATENLLTAANRLRADDQVALNRLLEENALLSNNQQEDGELNRIQAAAAEQRKNDSVPPLPLNQLPAATMVVTELEAARSALRKERDSHEATRASHRLDLQELTAAREGLTNKEVVIKNLNTKIGTLSRANDQLTQDKRALQQSPPGKENSTGCCTVS